MNDVINWTRAYSAGTPRNLMVCFTMVDQVRGADGMVKMCNCHACNLALSLGRVVLALAVAENPEDDEETQEGSERTR